MVWVQTQRKTPYYSVFEYIGHMDDFTKGTRTAFARAISAEVRAIMAARRISGRTLADGAGLSSHNYLAIRLRDEKPFTLDDLAGICSYLDEDSVEAFVTRASANHLEHQWVLGMEERRAAKDAAADKLPTLADKRKRRALPEIQQEAARPKRKKPKMGDD